jgi:DNA polymerase III epsilon subunit-like protein
LHLRFSGITEEDLSDVTTTIHDVQAVLLSMFNDKTILIGHSLESDMKALKVRQEEEYLISGNTLSVPFASR